MPFTTSESLKDDKFFGDLAPLLPAYLHQTVRFMAVRTDKGDYLLHLVLLLSPKPMPDTPSLFQTKHVLCREVSLLEMGYKPRQLINALSSGSISVSGEVLQFPADHAGNHTAHAWPLDGSIDGRFNQVGRLMIQGDSQRYVHSQNGDFHREVKANVRSYDSLAALGAAFGLEFQDYMNFCADIFAASVARIVELTRNEEHANVTVWLAPGLSTEAVTIALRVKLSPDARATPLDLPASPVWHPDADGGHICEMDIEIAEPDSVLSIVVSYAGIVQQERSVGPARKHVNSLRAALAPFQPEEDAFLAVLANQKLRDRDPAELERTVAAILAMRGFRVITADRVPGLQEVPDILAADADGNILVVECTLNTPNSEDKLAKLHRRREIILRAFHGTRQSETEVLALLAIPQTEETLRGYQEQARRLQILMWNKDDLNRLAQDESLPNSAEIFAGLRQALAMTEIFNGLLDGQDA